MKIEKGRGGGGKAIQREREKVFLLCISGMASQSITRNFVTTVNCAPDLTPPPPPLHRMYLFSPQEGRRKKKKIFFFAQTAGMENTQTHTLPLPSPPPSKTTILFSRPLPESTEKKKRKKERKEKKLETWRAGKASTFPTKPEGGVVAGKVRGSLFLICKQRGRGGFFFLLNFPVLKGRREGNIVLL